MCRSFFAVLTLFGSALSLGAAAAPSAAAPRKPNVVFFLVDDLGYGDLGVHGNPHVKTPHLDRFAKDAVALTRFYTAPVCNPTRAALMTGRYTFRTFVESDTRMAPDEVTIAEALRPAGYRTALFGKWHLGDGPTESPNAQGFEEVVTFPKGMLTEENHFDPVLIHNGKEQKYRGYCMEVWTELAIEFINAHRNEPFLLYVPVNLIHTPLIPPRGGEKPYAEVGLGENLAKVYAMAESADAGFGRLQSALKEAGLEDDTLFILGSDNGPAIQMDRDAKHDGERLGQLRGMKGDVYEGGIRTPWYIRWPSQFRGGQNVEHVTAHIDILPSILDACGVAPPKDVVLDGKALLPLLRDPSAAWPDRTVFIQWDSNNAPTREMCVAAITDEWKLVQPCGMTSTGPIRGLLRQYERLCTEIGLEQRNLSDAEPRFELYRIARDPGERQDVASSHADVMAEMRRQYNAWFDEIQSTARWKDSPRPRNTSKRSKGQTGQDE